MRRYAIPVKQMMFNGRPMPREQRTPFIVGRVCWVNCWTLAATLYSIRKYGGLWRV